MSDRSMNKTSVKESTENKQAHLPVMGVGPICVAIMVAFTAIGIALVKFGALAGGNVSGMPAAVLFVIAGILCIAGGITLWCAAVLGERIDDKIKSNRLATGGVYALVRNPIYSAFLFICTGALLFCRNRYVLILPPFLWLYLTVFMKLTEEKWLSKRFGDEYSEYCKRVNRFIPWKRSGVNL